MATKLQSLKGRKKEVREKEYEETIEEKVIGKELESDFLAEEDILKLYENSELPAYKIYKPESYKDGPEGFIKWCEEKVFIPIYKEGSDIATWTRIGELPTRKNPSTKRSYFEFWEEQKKVARQCLRMINNRFIYRLIVFCWPRGDGKSLFACLIQLWKFFNWPRQQIVLGANSKDQVQFVHYDIMRDIINNSPPLLQIIGKKNVQEKMIRIRDSKGNVMSFIRPISSFSGIVSNITGYTFSEVFDMKKPTFFTQLDGSTRNIPNALGVIDSTVSSKTHFLYNLFTSFVQKKSKALFFSYRYSRTASYLDYWNPNMTQEQLDDYRAKFPLQEFERYFMNTWGSVADRIFTEEQIEAMGYLGYDNRIGNFFEIAAAIKEKVKAKEIVEQITMTLTTQGFENESMRRTVASYEKTMGEIESKLVPVAKYYQLTDGFSSCAATIQDLSSLSDLFDTDWAILCSFDRADPLKESKLGARTMFVCMAKGLPGSRSNPKQFVENVAPNYLYLYLHIVNVESHSTDDLEDLITFCNTEYDGIDAMCSERWAASEIVTWAEGNIPLEVIFPTYANQRAAFTNYKLAVEKGMILCPPVYIPGSKENDILREEIRVFYHDSDKHWFGSPEKMEKYGIQDDLMFASAWCVFAGRGLGEESFRSRKGMPWFGTMLENRQLYGRW